MWKKVVNKLIVSKKEKPLTSSKEKKRKPDVIVVTEKVILVVTVVVRQETWSVRGVTRYDILLRFAKPKLSPEATGFLHEMCQTKGDRM